MTRPWRKLAGLTCATVLFGLGAPVPSDVGAQGLSDRAGLLAPRAQPRMPDEPGGLWLAPVEASRPTADVAIGRAARLHAAGKLKDAIIALRGVPTGTPLADYAAYYRGLAELGLGQIDAAHQVLSDLAGRPLVGYLSVGVRLRLAEIAEARQDFRTAAGIYEGLSRMPSTAPDELLMKLARARRAAGDLEGAAKAYARVLYEYPLGQQAEAAEAAITELDAWHPMAAGTPRYTLDLGRAEQLFAARKYAQAHAVFTALRPIASGDDRELVELRLAECDYYLGRHRAAREALAPWTTTARRRAEAQFFFLTATRSVGHHDEYLRLARALVDAFPGESWAEETLNNLATHYILADEDDKADAVFRETLERFPEGRHAPRAAWKVGWRAYRAGGFVEAASTFEGGAETFPRSDYRPAWLYWAGRAHEQAGRAALGVNRLAVVAADYGRSYYGRLASSALEARGHDRPTPADAVLPASRAIGDEAAETGVERPLPPTERLIRHLIAQEMYTDGLNEVLWAQKAWGNSATLDATLGLLYSRTGELRRGINAMKRAYPHYLSGGDELPDELQRILFPVEHWDLIRRHAGARGLDPYLVAALVAQESTFDPAITSSAGAIGLMQIMPRTGRQYARKLGIRRYSTRRLTDPEVNVRIGTAYFADLSQRLGGRHFALASYNAGESPVARWRAERGDLPHEEFIDDIPYPETQNYVKKILGAVDDYRRLYGPRPAATR